MNLLPIIRRKRRPLTPVDEPPVVPANIPAPAQTEDATKTISNEIADANISENEKSIAAE
jgi:hypothetical protein